MKKLQIFIIAILISLQICSILIMNAEAASATISLSRNSGYVGDIVTVSATTGFGIPFVSSITIRFDGVTMTTTPSIVITNNGGFVANFTIPNTTVGTHNVSATDTYGNIGVATFTVYPPLSLSVSPASWTMDVGQFRSFSASASGGSGTYTSYRWYVNGSVQSGQTTSMFTFNPGSVGTFWINVTVTDSLGTTSDPSTAVVAVYAYPSVSVAPVGPLNMNVGQVQVFTATVSGGSGSLSYRWYLDGSLVSGQTSSTYSYTAAGVGGHSVYVNVTDSASLPVTVKSNTVSITVNTALVAPSVSASSTVINQAQSSTFTSTMVSTGTSPYTYQWLVRAPGAGFYSLISGATLPGYSFVTSMATATGSWSFILRINDSAGASVNSSAVSVTVNIPPLDHFIFNVIDEQKAGSLFSITITAKDASNNTLTNYVGTNSLNISTGPISPTNTGPFVNGVWTGSVRVTKAGSGITLFTTGSGMFGTSNIFTVNPDILDHFIFDSIPTQKAGSPFNITVTARDIYENIVTDYTGSPSLTFSGGAINPTKMTPFIDGVGSTLVTVDNPVSTGTITVVDNSRAGISNSFTVSINPTPSPTPINTTSPTDTPTPPTQTPSPTPHQSETIIAATNENGVTVYFAIKGNITNSQISNVKISTANSTSTTISFNLTGEEGNSGFSNMTIPKTAIPFGTNPVIFMNDVRAKNQGFTQDGNNFYVWYTAEFSIHQVKIQFIPTSTSGVTEFKSIFAIAITVPEIVLVYVVIAIRRLRRKPENA